MIPQSMQPDENPAAEGPVMVLWKRWEIQWFLQV
jgi:hypothetical protein